MGKKNAHRVDSSAGVCGAIVAIDTRKSRIRMSVIVSSSAAEASESPVAGSRVTDIESAIRLLVAPGDVYEIRSPNCPQRRGGQFKATFAGYFDNATDGAKWARQIGLTQPAGIYLTLNPVDPSLLARSTNKAEFRAKHTTTDADIVRRRWLLVDIDSVRPAGVSAELSGCDLTDRELPTHHPFVPTPAMIKVECEKIRAGLSEKELRSRYMVPQRVRWRLPDVSISELVA